MSDQQARPPADPLKPPTASEAVGVLGTISGAIGAPSIEDRLTSLEKRFEVLLEHLDNLMKTLPSALSAGLPAVISEIGDRVHAVEMALASFAGPTISQDAHDGLTIFMKWWKAFEEKFKFHSSPPKAGGVPGSGESVSGP